MNPTTDSATERHSPDGLKTSSSPTPPFGRMTGQWIYLRVPQRSTAGRCLTGNGLEGESTLFEQVGKRYVTNQLTIPTSGVVTAKTPTAISRFIPRVLKKPTEIGQIHRLTIAVAVLVSPRKNAWGQNLGRPRPSPPLSQPPVGLLRGARSHVACCSRRAERTVGLFQFSAYRRPRLGHRPGQKIRAFGIQKRNQRQTIRGIPKFTPPGDPGPGVPPQGGGTHQTANHRGADFFFSCWLFFRIPSFLSIS